MGSRIHPVVHVCLLKRKVGTYVLTAELLPLVTFDNEKLIPHPLAVLDRRIRRRKQEVLIHWHGLSPVEATWVDRDFILEQFPDLTLEDKGEI